MQIATESDADTIHEESLLDELLADLTDNPPGPAEPWSTTRSPRSAR